MDSLYVTSDFLVTHNTLNDSFIVLDEAQNTSAEQMKMFLTRLGFGAKMVVTGDVTQVDLPAGTRSGLRIVQGILDGIEDVAFCRLTSQDVVRHKLVSDIVDAYARFDAETAASTTPRSWSAGAAPPVAVRPLTGRRGDAPWEDHEDRDRQRVRRQRRRAQPRAAGAVRPRPSSVCIRWSSCRSGWSTSRR